MPYQPTPLKPNQTWVYHPVENVLGGIDLQKRSDQLADNQCITLRNVLMKQGQLLSDTGFKLFGQVIVGQPQLPVEFDHQDGTVEQMLVTTKTVYVWNNTLQKWMLLKGTAGTTTTSGYSAGATSIVVASGTGFSTADLVSIALDDGSQLQTTITKTGTTFAIADAVPVGRSVANGAVVNRAVALTGSLSNQVSEVTIPGSNWWVFTNGVDIVKRYNGTDCVDVPNLPSTGNTICAAVALYNTALFLLNTNEGGTPHPQRARRSDQTDPTNWTTGTAGFDDLLDSTDPIQCGRLLGPYLIVYRKKSIARGEFIGASGFNYNFETTIRGEGAASVGSVADVITDDGTFHVLLGQKNVYIYHGDYTLVPIGDQIFFRAFSTQGNLDPQYVSRNWIVYVKELDEILFFYTSVTSATQLPDQTLRYSFRYKAWYERIFFDQFSGAGVYAQANTFTWNDLVGDWNAQAWNWDSQSISAKASVLLLCDTEESQVFAYDYVSALDNATAIAYTVETKDYILPDARFRFDLLEFMIQGTGIKVEFSTDKGLSWTTLDTITQAVLGKVQIYKQFVVDRVRFRWSGSSPDFIFQWYAFNYKIESDY